MLKMLQTSVEEYKVWLKWDYKLKMMSHNKLQKKQQINNKNKNKKKWKTRMMSTKSIDYY